MFHRNLIAVVKVNGQILRETNHTSDSGLAVSLPFGSEYSVLFKNQDTRRVVIKMTIDGDDVLDGNSIVLDGNSKFELNGFMKKHSVTHRFKFMQKTSKVIDARGDNIDDGFIRIEFAYEEPCYLDVNTFLVQPQPQHQYHHHHHHYHEYQTPFWSSTKYTMTSGPSMSSPSCDLTNSVSVNSLRSVSKSIAHTDEGITVKGQRIRQDLKTTCVSSLGNWEVINIRLLGKTSVGSNIRHPKTTKQKITCDKCGSSNKSSANFCSVCGNNLK